MEKGSICLGRAIAALAAGAHLGVVVLFGLLRVDLWSHGCLGRAAVYYGAISGADLWYGFFAPDVHSPPTARFRVVDAKGAVITDSLGAGINREVEIRAGNIVNNLWPYDDAEAQRRLASSWADAMFARHPAATGVEVQVMHYHLPPMDRFREGERPRWEVLYQESFVATPDAHAAPRADGEMP